MPPEQEEDVIQAQSVQPAHLRRQLSKKHKTMRCVGPSGLSGTFRIIQINKGPFQAWSLFPHRAPFHPFVFIITIIPKQHYCYHFLVCKWLLTMVSEVVEMLTRNASYKKNWTSWGWGSLLSGTNWMKERLIHAPAPILHKNKTARLLDSPLSEWHGPGKANGELFWQWHQAEGIVPEETSTKGRASSEVYSITESAPFR